MVTSNTLFSSSSLLISSSLYSCSMYPGGFAAAFFFYVIMSHVLRSRLISSTSCKIPLYVVFRVSSSSLQNEFVRFVIVLTNWWLGFIFMIFGGYVSFGVNLDIESCVRWLKLELVHENICCTSYLFGIKRISNAIFAL